MEFSAPIAKFEGARIGSKLHRGVTKAMVFAAAIFLAGCAGMEPRNSTPFNAAAQLPASRAPDSGAKVSPEHRQMIALFDGEYEYRSAENYLNDILAKLAKADERASEPYKVTILNSPTVNALIPSKPLQRTARKRISAIWVGQGYCRPIKQRRGKYNTPRPKALGVQR